MILLELCDIIVNSNHPGGNGNGRCLVPKRDR